MVLRFYGRFGDPSPQWLAQFDPHHWKMTRILAGGVYTFPLNRKKNLDLLARALAGVQQTKTSEYGFVVEYPSGEIMTSDFPGRTLPWTFTYQADAGLEWRLYRRLAVLVYSGYNGSRPSYTQNMPTDKIAKFYFPTCSFLLRGGVQIGL